MKAKRGRNFQRILHESLPGLLLMILLLGLVTLVSLLQLERWQSELLVMLGLTVLVLASLPWESQ